MFLILQKSYLDSRKVKELPIELDLEWETFDLQK